ncbi:hypothetical protein ABIC73_001965 [Prescottella equi]|uniref:hypothetical protein n=1 Tax=Rhodococcus hoagii TaxID=43767 RepID=UPI0033966694
MAEPVRARRWASTDAGAPGEPDEAEYERLTNPDKFVIVVARAPGRGLCATGLWMRRL